jgi:MYXO-CTERM domain-containing protein
MLRFWPIALFVISAMALPARATYHTYRFAEVYSNATGTIQFIMLHESFNAAGQNLLSEAPDIFSFTGTNTVEHDFTIPNNLPNTSTANTFVLFGTAGYNALPGAPHTDYIIPNNFFNPAGDSLQYGSTGPDGIVDTITFGALSSDPTQALFRTGITGSVFTTGQAVANTFSSGGGFDVPEPGASMLALVGFAGFTLRRRRVA